MTMIPCLLEKGYLIVVTFKFKENIMPLKGFKLFDESGYIKFHARSFKRIILPNSIEKKYVVFKSILLSL